MARVWIKKVEIEELLEALNDMRKNHIMVDLECDDQDQVLIIHPVKQQPLTDRLVEQLKTN